VSELLQSLSLTALAVALILTTFQLGRLYRRLDALEDELRPRTCRVCGCTDEAACWPACWWVDEDLCSSCARTSGPVDGGAS
jgi:hypothetical protein